MLGQTQGPQRLHALFMIGVLGAFTTFSAFSMESLRLYEDGRSVMALVNVLANNVGALAAVVAGVWAGRSLTA
jgi:CrcB protein